MSEMVYYRGVLKPVEKQNNETLEKQCKRILNIKKLPFYYNSYAEMILGEYYQEYVVNNDILYIVEKENVDPYGDIFIADKNEDETINFEIRYYNGGCGFNEAIEIALNNME